MNPQGNVTDIQNQIGQYEQFLKVDPQNAQLLFNLGDLYQRLGRPEEAQGRYLRACELLEIRAIDDPDDPKLLSELAD